MYVYMYCSCDSLYFLAFYFDLIVRVVLKPVLVIYSLFDLFLLYVYVCFDFVCLLDFFLLFHLFVSFRGPEV